MAKAGSEFTIREEFKYGYRNREDVTVLKPTVLVSGSKNVLTSVNKRVGCRKGYVIDGQRDTSGSSKGIWGSFDFFSNGGRERNTRVGGVNSALQYRHVAIGGEYLDTETLAEGDVRWIDVLAGLGTTFSACNFFDLDYEKTTMMLFVDGTSNIRMWNGAVAMISGTSNAAGSVGSINATIPNGGSNYAVGDVLTVGTGTGATVEVTAVTGVTGVVTGVTVNAAGARYALGSRLELYAGGHNCHLLITGIDGNGGVTSVSLIEGGTGYSAATVNASGNGYGCTITVTSVTAVSNAVSSVKLLTPGQGYSVGTLATTGGTGSGCTLAVDKVGTGYIKLDRDALDAGFLSQSRYSQKLSVYHAAGNTEYSYSWVVGDYLVNIGSNPTSETANRLAFQSAVTVPNSQIAYLPDDYKNTIIGALSGYTFVGGTDNTVYMSKVSNFMDFSFSAIRRVGEGALFTLDGTPTAFEQQTDTMYISAGHDFWYEVTYKLSSDNAYEEVDYRTIKTTAKQGAKFGMTTKIKNLVAFVSNETQVNTLGISANFFTEPQVSDISFPIVNDMNILDFTGGQVIYHRKFLYVTAPISGVMLIYNMTQDMTDGLVDKGSHYWEAPQILPFAKLSIIGGELYGHGFQSNNTYKLFTGYNDDGHSYDCAALFAYETYDLRSDTKSDNELFVEGYKTAGTEITVSLRRELNGQLVSWSHEALGEPFSVIPTDLASIGKDSIGKQPIGSTSSPVPPYAKFRLIETYARVPYFEQQFGVSSSGVDQIWELVSFGTNASVTTEKNTSIKDPPLS